MSADPKSKAKILATASAAAIAACLTAGAARAQDAPPNIMLIILDDIGFDVTTGMYPGMIEDLSARYGPDGLDHPDADRIAGHPASTPVLDEFAEDGMVFSNAWAQPFCSPTRASMLTGLFSAKTRVLTYADPLASTHESFVRNLKEDAGYATGVFGKWHMAGIPSNQPPYPGMKPKQAGFDLFEGNMHAAPLTYWDYDYEIQDDSSPDDMWRTEEAPVRSLPGIAPTTYAPVVKAADTIDWITAQEQADPDKPWFAWVAFNLSHATISSDPTQMIVPNADTLDDVSRQEMEACNGVFESADLGDCSGEASMRAMTNSVDTVIGKVLDAVDALDPNTYVIIIADNGTPMYGRPGLDFIDNMYITRDGRGKGTVYESGARVTLAVRGPNIQAGARSDEFVHAVDIFPTVLNLGGLESPAMVPDADNTGEVAVDGVSLSPILFGQADHVRDPNEGFLLTESRNLMAAGAEQVGVRNRDYKLVCDGNAAIEACAFYNLVNDPLEEYPLPKPADCAGFADGLWNTAEESWQFCRLQHVAATESFFKDAP